MGFKKVSRKRREFWIRSAAFAPLREIRLIDVLDQPFMGLGVGYLLKLRTEFKPATSGYEPRGLILLRRVSETSPGKPSRKH